jgi:hypothetical protein
MFKIALPKPSEYENNIPLFLSQMKIVIKATEKSYELLTKDLTTEELKQISLIYRFPEIDLEERENDENGFVKVHVDEETNQMQDIEIEIFSI